MGRKDYRSTSGRKMVRAIPCLEIDQESIRLLSIMFQIRLFSLVREFTARTVTS